jgi:hypothetical protein
MSTIITGPRVTNEGYGQSIGLERWKVWGNFESECEAQPQVPQLAPPIIDFCLLILKHNMLIGRN